MVIRVTLANIEPQELAAVIQGSGLSGTVFQSWGAGSWGVEPGATVEFAGSPHATILGFVRGLLQSRHEEAAYVTVDGTAARLWNADGSVVVL